MTGVEALAVIAAAVVTVYATAVAAHPTMPAARKRAIAALVAVGLGVVSALVTGAIEGVPATVTDWTARILVSVAAVVVAAQGFYAAFKGHLSGVEAATSKPRRARGDLGD